MGVTNKRKTKSILFQWGSNAEPLVQSMAGEAVTGIVPGFDLLVTEGPWLATFLMWSLRILWFPAPIRNLDLVSKLH